MLARRAAKGSARRLGPDRVGRAVLAEPAVVAAGVISGGRAVLAAGVMLAGRAAVAGGMMLAAGAGQARLAAL